jgi:hypothetical protein
MIQNIAMKHWHMLTSDPTLSQEFKDPPPIFVYKRGPNIHSRLVQGSLNTVAKQTLLTPLRDGNYPVAIVLSAATQTHKVWKNIQC